jgi:hypothetical protein
VQLTGKGRPLIRTVGIFQTKPVLALRSNEVKDMLFSPTSRRILIASEPREKSRRVELLMHRNEPGIDTELVLQERDAGQVGRDHCVKRANRQRQRHLAG